MDNKGSIPYRKSLTGYLGTPPLMNNGHDAQVGHHSSSALPGPFKFLNLWAEQEDFLPTVNSVWQTRIEGDPMFQLTSKLHLLKSHLKTFHKHHSSSSHISRRVAEAKEEWKTTHLLLDQNPLVDDDLMTNERRVTRKYTQLCDDEEAYCKHKSRATSLVIIRKWAEWQQQQLTMKASCQPHLLQQTISYPLLEHLKMEQINLSMQITDKEIKDVLHSIPDDKVLLQQPPHAPPACTAIASYPTELLPNYHLNKGPPRCALKVDLKKAFDTISWQFIIEGLKAVGIPNRMVYWTTLFILPYFRIRKLESALAAFLWKGTFLNTTRAKRAPFLAHEHALQPILVLEEDLAE
ncbi:hypothetical protein NC652_031196 [Populus alba x Populus x berolinensis]|nr:hypothetical protein NC652_031196 [Populus alba x Populus x berolinensis]